MRKTTKKMSNTVRIEGAGNVLYELRTDADLTLEQLADRLDWDKGRLSKYENNHLGLSLDVIEEIARALGVRAERIVLLCLQKRYPAIASPRSKVGKLLQQAVDEMTR